MSQSADTVTQVDPVLLECVYDRLGGRCEAAWLEAAGHKFYSSQFLEKGYKIWPIPTEIARRFQGFFADSRAEKLQLGATREDYLNAVPSAKEIERFNRENTFYGRPCEDAVEAFGEFVGSIEHEIEEQLAHCWQITNVRAWSVNAKAEYGAVNWHADGFSRYVRKMLIYVNPLSDETGSIDITTRQGEVVRIESEGAVAVLFDAGVLAHRAVPPTATPRPVIEVIIVPAEETCGEFTFAGQLGRVPIDVGADIREALEPTRYVKQKIKPLYVNPVRRLKRELSRVPEQAAKSLKKAFKNNDKNRKLPSVTNRTGCLNLGGGRKFSHKGWINLEGGAGRANPFPFRFHPETIFPVPSSSISLVYSSHCLEHLDDPTVDRVLEEARRVVGRDGALVLKLPDGDRTLEAWRAGDGSYFDGWGFSKIVHTWPAYGVEDNVHTRAATIFCGFWNNAAGNPFSGDDTHWIRDAYHGPPRQTMDMLEDLLALETPHQIAARLRQAVIDTETDYAFNHQNGWSREELRALLAEWGFEVESFDADAVIDRYRDVPRIKDMDDISVYCMARPA